MSELSTKIARLLCLMIGTDKPGETVAAADATRRTLAAAGLDHHDLAAVVEAGLRVPLVPDDGSEDWKSVALFCRHHRDRLGEKETEFLETILQYRRSPTERQLQWLHDIHVRIRRECQ